MLYLILPKKDFLSKDCSAIVKLYRLIKYMLNLMLKNGCINVKKYC